MVATALTPRPDQERRCLLDTSAYARAGDPRVVPVLTEAAREGRLVACGPFVCEALYSARDRRELADILEELTRGMPYVETGEEVFRLAHRAALELSRVSERFHRRPPIDYLIAAGAHVHRLGVMHYDRDYDLIAEHSSLDFESRWVVAAGSL